MLLLLLRLRLHQVHSWSAAVAGRFVPSCHVLKDTALLFQVGRLGTVSASRLSTRRFTITVETEGQPVGALFVHLVDSEHGGGKQKVLQLCV